MGNSFTYVPFELSRSTIATKPSSMTACAWRLESPASEIITRVMLDLPETYTQWLAIIALGVGPVGAAFFTWDIGMKRGDIRVLGAASYATPLLSTAFLTLAGFARPTATLAIAAILIAGGGLIAAKDMVWRR